MQTTTQKLKTTTTTTTRGLVLLLSVGLPHHSGWMPFLPPNRQRQNTEGKTFSFKNCSYVCRTYYSIEQLWQSSHLSWWESSLLRWCLMEGGRIWKHAILYALRYSLSSWHCVWHSYKEIFLLRLCLEQWKWSQIDYALCQSNKIKSDEKAVLETRKIRLLSDCWNGFWEYVSK